MKAPTIPDGEAERLAALYELEILDTDTEERFDRIVRIVSSLLCAPIAYISFVDQNRQWLKSSCGFDKCETPREESFCGHTILQDDCLVICDARMDSRFSDNPLVVNEPFIRFYAGCPLQSASGHNVGTLCVADHAPRVLSAVDRSLLRDLADMAEEQLALQEMVSVQRTLRKNKSKLQRSHKELERETSFLKETFGRYVTSEVAEQILKDPNGLQLGGETRHVTVLMSDLRGFTPMSEEMPAGDVVATLNRYLERMVDIIIKYSGTIDSFIGDAILVLFGVPVSDGNDAKRAVACALEMQSAMAELNQSNASMGLPEIQMGIGITSGEVIVGNIGSHQRMKYSAIGAPVNRAARIESFTLGGQILISETTLAEVGDVVRVDGNLRVKAKGVNKPVAIYDIGGIGGEYNIYLPETDCPLRRMREEAVVQSDDDRSQVAEDVG